MAVRDIRIIGGGFAGVATALTLLNGPRPGAYEVTIYERAATPYTTLCGEGISETTLRRFAAFDSEPYIAERFRGASWSFPGGTRVLVDQPCFTMARETWIPAMAKAAQKLGADFKPNVKVTVEDVERFSREADLVIGADGPGSQTRRYVGGHHETLLGIQYRVPRDAYETDRLEFVTDKRWSPEYAWVFPRGHQHNVGLLTDPGIGVDENWQRLDAFMAAQGVDASTRKREAYPIGFFGTRFQRGNVVLIGDAAGLTNPVTKGGMAAVVYAAELLAECVADDAVGQYEDRLLKHPLTSKAFRRGVDIIHRWSNDDFARLARFAPRTMVVTPQQRARRRYWWPIAKSLAWNPSKATDLLALARAMGESRLYSW